MELNMLEKARVSTTPSLYPFIPSQTMTPTKGQWEILNSKTQGASKNGVFSSIIETVKSIFQKFLSCLKSLFCCKSSKAMEENGSQTSKSLVQKSKDPAKSSKTQEPAVQLEEKASLKDRIKSKEKPDCSTEKVRDRTISVEKPRSSPKSPKTEEPRNSMPVSTSLPSSASSQARGDSLSPPQTSTSFSSVEDGKPASSELADLKLTMPVKSKPSTTAPAQSDAIATSSASVQKEPTIKARLELMDVEFRHSFYGRGLVWGELKGLIREKKLNLLVNKESLPTLIKRGFYHSHDVNSRIFISLMASVKEFAPEGDFGLVQGMLTLSEQSFALIDQQLKAFDALYEAAVKENREADIALLRETKSKFCKDIASGLFHDGDSLRTMDGHLMNETEPYFYNLRKKYNDKHFQINRLSYEPFPKSEG
jgi:hypothetical protein